MIRQPALNPVAFSMRLPTPVVGPRPRTARPETQRSAAEAEFRAAWPTADAQYGLWGVWGSA